MFLRPGTRSRNSASLSFLQVETSSKLCVPKFLEKSAVFLTFHLSNSIKEVPAGTAFALIKLLLHHMYILDSLGKLLKVNYGFIAGMRRIVKWCDNGLL